MHLTRKDMIKAAIPAYGFLVVSFPFVGVAHPPQASMSQSRVMKANPLPTATPVLHRTTESKREVNVLDHVIEPVLSFVLGAALTAVFFVRKRSNRFIRIRHNFRTLERWMSVLRDKQESQVVAIVPAADKVIETLNVDDEGVFNKILDELYDAANICKDQFDLILTLQQHLAAGQESRRKEITEAANHALKEIYKAREVLKDSKAVKWPYGFGNPDHDITRTP